MVIGVVKFSSRRFKIKKILHKNRHIQIKYCILGIGVKGRCQEQGSRRAKILLSKSIFGVKNHWNLSQYFSLKNTNLGAHFLLLTLFDNINCETPNFDSSPILKIN